MSDKLYNAEELLQKIESRYFQECHSLATRTSLPKVEASEILWNGPQPENMWDPANVSRALTNNRSMMQIALRNAFVYGIQQGLWMAKKDSNIKGGAQQ